MPPVRILIPDDNPLVRSGIKMLLRLHRDWAVCAEVENGCDAVEKAAESEAGRYLAGYFNA